MADPGAQIEHDFTRGWTREMVAYHEDLVAHCRQHAWMHYSAEAHYTRLYWALAIPTTLLSVITGSVGLVSVSEITSDPLWYILVSLFVLNIAVGFLTGINALLEPNTTAKDHRGTASEFGELAHWIQLQLNTDIRYRDHCESVSRVASVRYSNLLANSAMEPSWITRRLLSIIPDDAPLPEQALGGRRHSPVHSADMFYGDGLALSVGSPGGGTSISGAVGGAVSGGDLTLPAHGQEGQRLEAQGEVGGGEGRHAGAAQVAGDDQVCVPHGAGEGAV